MGLRLEKTDNIHRRRRADDLLKTEDIAERYYFHSNERQNKPPPLSLTTNAKLSDHNAQCRSRLNTCRFAVVSFHMHHANERMSKYMHLLI